MSTLYRYIALTVLLGALVLAGCGASALPERGHVVSKRERAPYCHPSGKVVVCHDRTFYVTVRTKCGTYENVVFARRVSRYACDDREYRVARDLWLEFEPGDAYHVERGPRYVGKGYGLGAP